MALILAFQHPVLGYCSSSHDFYIADCKCSAPANDEASCCQEICESCLSTDPEEAPYQDCCKKISYDPGDILWTPSSEPEPFVGAELAPLPQLKIPSLVQASLASSFIPPPLPPPYSCPLFLRLGVMLL